MPGNPRSAVVVVNFGSTPLLSLNLPPTLAGLHHIVVIVDNPTTAQEREQVHRLASEHGWLVEEPATNLGFGGGVNVGAQRALAEGAEALLILNPDARLEPAAVEDLFAAVHADPLQMVAPLVRTPDGQAWFAGAGIDLTTGQTVGPQRLGEPLVEPWLSGACFGISAQLWRAVGGFDDDYFLYWEDVDLSRRVREAGGRIAVLSDVVAVHDEGGTHEDRPDAGASRAKSDTYYYFNIRNRMLYARKHLTPVFQRRWLLCSPAAAWEVLLRGGRRQFLHSRTPLLSAVKAALDGAFGRTGPRSPVPSYPAPAAAFAPNAHGAEGCPVKVLMTYMEPLPFHNPYVKMLDDALRATGAVEVRHFSWREALAGDFDVVHAHWPEDVLSSTTRLKGAVKRACLAAFIARCRLQGIPVVRTVHNLELPSGLDPAKHALLVAFDKITTDKILISETTPKPPEPHCVILHGDYRDWYSAFEQSESVPGRIVYFGMVRRYKNVERLAEVFAETATDHSQWSLVIAGNPSSPDLVEVITAHVGDDERVSMQLRYLEDAELVSIASTAQLVVLPYREMHNSGSLLAALSLGRPVLVPNNSANQAIADEVGADWVQLYDGELEVADLERAMDVTPAGTPDLTRRNWAQAGLDHLAFYRDAIARQRD